MPGPTTEVLNDDLKALRSDLHQAEKTLAADLHRFETTLSTAVGSLAAEFKLFKWLVGAALMASVSGVISSAYWAGSLATRVSALETRADKVDGRLDRIETGIAGLNSRLDRIEASLAKVASRTDGVGGSPPEKR